MANSPVESMQWAMQQAAQMSAQRGQPMDPAKLNAAMLRLEQTKQKLAAASTQEKFVFLIAKLQGLKPEQQNEALDIIHLTLAAGGLV